MDHLRLPVLLTCVVFLISLCISTEGLLIEESKWLHRKDTLKTFPLRAQIGILKQALGLENVNLTGEVPSNIDGQLPDITEYLVNGAIDVYLSQHPEVAQSLGPVVQGGIKRLTNVFGGRKVYLPDLPCVIYCPADIVRTQDKAHLDLATVVTWQVPVGYDAEDGVLHNVTRAGPAPGSRLSGDNSVLYSVHDHTMWTDYCTFTVTVKAIQCPRIPLDHVLRTDCRGFRIYYGDVCNFSCPAGYTLKGRSALTCNIEGQYDGQRPTCESADPSYGSSKRILTQEAPHKRLVLGGSGPTITNCPANYKLYAQRGKESTTAAWYNITATDGKSGKVTVTQVKGQPSGRVFSEGTHELSFEAVDNAGLKDTCDFYIDVEVLHCSVPKLRNSEIGLNCNDSIKYGSGCSLSCSHGRIQGATSMSCERRDGKMVWEFLGPEPSCVAIPCQKPELPTGGLGWNCSNDYKYNSVCTLECDAGYRVARNFDGSEGYIQCTVDGTWTGRAECIADVGAIMGAINEQKQELNSIKTMLTNIVDQLKNSGNIGGTN